MSIKSVFLLLAAVLLLGVPVGAETAPIVDFKLSLAGYQIDMTYDEAVAVRPFDVIGKTPEIKGSAPFDVGFVDGIFVDDVEMNLRVYFRDGKLCKVVGRFNPALLDDLLERFRTVMGVGRDRSRRWVNYAGAELDQSVFSWRFPAATLTLTKISTNTDFALVSLIGRTDQSPNRAENEH